MKKIFFLFIFIFCFNSVVLAYEYNGEPLETNAKAGDSFLGVQEVENILDTLEVTYSGENELLAYTYYINDVFDYYREFYSDNTISNLNFLFYTNNSKDRLTIVPGNGTFSSTLRYNYINIDSRLLTTVKSGTTPTVGNPPTTESTQFTTLNKNGIIQQATTSLYLPTSTEFLISENNLSVSTLVAPINTFSIYSGPPYSYYNIASTFKFFGDIEIPSGDSPGSGESGNVDLSGIQTGINNINNNLNNIENKIPTSGDVKDIISGETDKIISIFSGDTSNIDSGDSSILTDNKYQIDDPTEDILTGTFKQIADVMMTVDDSPIQTEFMGKQIELRPDYWKIPDGPLKALFVAYFSYWVGKTIILDIRKTINKFKEGNFEQIATEDITADMV